MTNWFIGRNGQKVGPLTIYQVKQLASLGMVQASDHLLQEGTTHWVPASSLTWLSFTPVLQKYYVNIAGNAHGPYCVEQIRAALLSGRIPPETLVCAQDGQEWNQVQRMVEFQSALPTVLDTPKKTHNRKKEMSAYEAELYLAGKRGDSMAKLIASLLDMKQKHTDNPTLMEIIEKNIRSLDELRTGGSVLASR